jgi:hypothetical protein
VLFHSLDFLLFYLATAGFYLALARTGSWRAQKITRARGGISIDLSEALPRETYFTDVYTHFSADGNRLVAEAMLTQLANALADDR